MQKLQILMPLGGMGSRFAKVGFELPKPLIPVDGVPMFLKAIDSLAEIAAEKKFYFVIRQEHITTQNLDALIKEALPEAKVIVIPKLTRGAAETAFAAKDSLSPEDGLIVMDCDIWFKSTSYNKMVTNSLSSQSDIAGGLLTFPSSDPRYSYAKLGGGDIVTQTAEKIVISNHAITGAYFFATGQEFISSAEQLLQKSLTTQMPEYYLSLLYNILINEGKKIQAAVIDEFASFGTPEELKIYRQSQKS